MSILFDSILSDSIFTTGFQLRLLTFLLHSDSLDSHFFLCMLVDIECGEPDRPNTNGGLVVEASGTDFNSTAVYSCDVGFVIVGNATRRCQENGNWSDVAPQCEGQS